MSETPTNASSVPASPPSTPSSSYQEDLDHTVHSYCTDDSDAVASIEISNVDSPLSAPDLIHEQSTPSLPSSPCNSSPREMTMCAMCRSKNNDTTRLASAYQDQDPERKKLPRGRSKRAGSSPSSSNTKTYIPITKCQLKQHNNAQSGIWLLCGTTVYDATNYIEHHPGGVKSILRKSGGVVDCTKDMGFHSPSAVKLWKKMQIGYLVPCCTSDDTRGDTEASVQNENGHGLLSYGDHHSYQSSEQCVIC